MEFFRPASGVYRWSSWTKPSKRRPNEDPQSQADQRAEIPETWMEGEGLIAKAMRYHEGRPSNTAIKNVCAMIAFALKWHQELTPDPTTALAFLMPWICQKKGAGLNETGTDRKDKETRR